FPRNAGSQKRAPQPRAAIGTLGSFRDLDLDGVCEWLSVQKGTVQILSWETKAADWKALPFSLPGGIALPGSELDYSGLRFVDIDEDGYDDIVFSNAERFGVYLFNDMQTGWSRVVLEGTRPAPEASGRREPAGGNEGPARPQVALDK